MQTLLSGCSLSDWCGFGEKVPRPGLPPMAKIGNHDDPRCWYNIVKQKLNLDLTNVSYGGYSNEEILNQLCKKLVLHHYDLVLLQLTTTQRKWFYRAQNPFDFCLAHGANSQNEQEKSMLDFFRVYFNNELVEIEKTLSTLLLVQRYLQMEKIPLIVINGFGFGEIIVNLATDAEKFCRKRIPSEIWEAKGKTYSAELGAIAGKINLDSFVALDKNFVSLGIDKADDGMHPGAESNKLYADLVIKKIAETTKDR